MHYKTKQGDLIDFVIIEDAEGDNNRSWICHHIHGYVKGNHVGYIKIAYIPKERFEKRYKSIFDYEININGKGWLEYYYDLSETKGKIKAAYRLLNNGYWLPETLCKQIDALSDEQTKFLFKRIMRKINRYSWRNFASFKNYHVDKPLVDYILVKENWQRQGIATAFYNLAAQWLATRFGLKLYASGLQSKEAKAAWNKLRATHSHVGKEIVPKKYRAYARKERTFLSYLKAA